MSIAIKTHKAFVDTLLSRYLEYGFGTLTKREIDILMMHLVLEHSDLQKTSNHELSIKFKISESKISTLRYEAKLKYVQNQESYVKEEFFKVLGKAQFEVDKKRIIFSVEDKYLKTSIQAKLKEQGSFADSSFNTELVKISEDAFVSLLASFYTEKERKNFENKVKKLIKTEDAISFQKIIRSFLAGASQKAGEKVIDIGSSYFSGGLSDILDSKILNNITKFIKENLKDIGL